MGSRYKEGNYSAVFLAKVTWYRLSCTVLVSRALNSKYSLFHILTLSLSDTLESIGGLGDETNWEGTAGLIGCISPVKEGWAASKGPCTMVATRPPLETASSTGASVGAPTGTSSKLEVEGVAKASEGPWPEKGAASLMPGGKEDPLWLTSGGERRWVTSCTIQDTNYPWGQAVIVRSWAVDLSTAQH